LLRPGHRRREAGFEEFPTSRSSDPSCFQVEDRRVTAEIWSTDVLAGLVDRVSSQPSTRTLDGFATGTRTQQIVIDP